MKNAIFVGRLVVAGAVLVIVILAAAGCGDPTAELLEGMATRVASVRRNAAAIRGGTLCQRCAHPGATPAERAAGLSGYDELPEDAGMLFVFAEPWQPSFWMKGMRFALDIIWMRDDTVVQIHAAVPPPPPDTPDDQLPRYRPNHPITHVLELNAGAAARLGIAVGDRIALCADGTPTAGGGS